MRESKTDIPLLVRAILGRWNVQYRKEKRISEGVILYLGEEIVPFSRNIHAVPLPALWSW